MTKFMSKNYQTRFQRVLDYIDTHLDDQLTSDVLSGVAAFSKFHFHRQFSSLFGIAVSKYVQLKRLKRAGHQLAYRDMSITDIAYGCGYESPEAFARAFKAYFAQTPTDFRKTPNWEIWLATFEPLAKVRIPDMAKAYSNDDIELVDFPETRIAVLEHKGDPKGIPNSVRKFISWRKENGLPPSESATFNILHDNPNEVSLSGYRIDICAEIKSHVKDNKEGIIEKIIPSGMCAKLRYVGSNEQLDEAVSFIYSAWLPRSSMETRDFPLFLQRIKFFPECAEHEAITDIFLPLR